MKRVSPQRSFQLAPLETQKTEPADPNTSRREDARGPAARRVVV